MYTLFIKIDFISAFGGLNEKKCFIYTYNFILCNVFAC